MHKGGVTSVRSCLLACQKENSRPGLCCNCLLSLQASAEMPFDGTGLDDVFLELTGEFSEVLDMGPGLPMFNDSGACFDAARSAQAAAAAAAAAAVAAPAGEAASAAGRSSKKK
jgi:hypothetical protein